ncbi:hypothetical protein BDQ12DRAFT_675029 [Crucibulum laeve]|uniref:Uncharacterized protein n=1 Tax=Crucibulum laeve TaxID=68775 RepID=A0A5C3MHP3_9AGAR|nr:hypothetical protein BDQ12DRAFT_675029 [Crucibulum laeve]
MWWLACLCFPVFLFLSVRFGRLAVGLKNARLCRTQFPISTVFSCLSLIVFFLAIFIIRLSTAMQKDMSYRKPVPKYIPSPPPSPPSSPRSMSLFYTPSLLEEDAPPLPNDWRDVINKVAVPTKPQPALIMPGSDIYPSITVQEPYISEQVSANTVDCPSSPSYTNDDSEGWPSPPSRSTTYTPSANSRERKRRLHQHYRPPTPPLPAQNKRRRLPDIEPEESTFNKTDTKEDTYHDISFTDTGPSSLRSASSFRTEKTLVSFDRTEPSMLWSGATCGSDSEAGDHSIPVLPMHIVNYDMVRKINGSSGNPSPSPANKPSWWERAGTTLKSKLWSFSRVFCC